MRLRAQVSCPAWVCFSVMNPLREQREYAVHEAAQHEREAWVALEQASRPDATDEAAVSTFRRRWQAAARSLTDALRALKS
jgi:hypothetical protein